MSSQIIDLTRTAEELTAYAAQRLVGFERQMRFSPPYPRTIWI